MTDEQINAAIAEACGWRKEDGVYMWTANGIDCTCPELWDWANDLNAMHEAERVLTDDQYMHFSDYLYDMECIRQKQTKKWRWLSTTARQRAEAFLRTLGKWEEPV